MHENISILIVEDEDIWIRNLQLSLEDFGFDVVSTAKSLSEALIAFKEHHYDLVLLDIHLDGKNTGIELGKILTSIYKKPFIFITASFDSHTMQEAAAARPSAYLTKPVNTSSLFIAIQNALHNFSVHHTASIVDMNETMFQSFFVKNGSKYKKIDWQDVVYLSSGKNYISVFNARDKAEYPIRSSLQNALHYIIPQKMQSQFVQINRSEVVQLQFILEITGDQIRTEYKTFTLSEGFSKDIRKKLNILT
ncbi:MAG: response regulator [Sphingobacteriales bacterium]|nr:MAG: response regulator [Sphingobacteriales bacterium]